MPDGKEQTFKEYVQEKIDTVDSQEWDFSVADFDGLSDDLYETLRKGDNKIVVETAWLDNGKLAYKITGTYEGNPEEEDNE
jgi:hypothetical protein